MVSIHTHQEPDRNWPDHSKPDHSQPDHSKPNLRGLDHKGLDHKGLDRSGLDTSSQSVAFRAFDLVRNIAILGGLYLAYSFVRQLTADDRTAAFANAARLLDFQNAIGLPSETILQYQFLRHPEVITAANNFYMWVHFPATALFLGWAWHQHRHHFGVIRASLISLTTAGLILHLLFPLAPPRMLKSVGYIDTGALFGPSPYDLAASSAANQIAAMPSLHVGWAILIAISVVALSRSRLRYLILAHPIITTLVVIVTANHYWTDAIIAALLVAGSWLFMVRLRNLPMLNFDNTSDAPPPPPARIDLVALDQATQMRIEDFAELSCSPSVGVDR